MVNSLVSILAAIAPDKKVKVVLSRNEKDKTVKATLTNRKEGGKEYYGSSKDFDSELGIVSLVLISRKRKIAMV